MIPWFCSSIELDQVHHQKFCQDVFGVSRAILSRSFLESINPLGSYSIEQIKKEKIIGCFNIETTNDYCHVVIDCTFIERAPPATLSFEEKKKYWSAKNHTIRYKFLCVVDSRGICVHCSRMFQGSVHDVEIVRHPFTLQFLLNVVDEFDGKIFGDKSFIGLNEVVPTLTPQRANTNWIIEGLDAEIASKRIIIENYFSRIKNQFPVLCNLSKTPLDYLENLFITLVYLTN